MNMHAPKDWHEKARYLHRKGMSFTMIAAALDKSWAGVREVVDPDYRAKRRETAKAHKQRREAVAALAINEAKPETREEKIARLRAAGWGWERIAKEMKLSPTGARYIGDPVFRERMKEHNRLKHREKGAAQRAAWGKPVPVEAPADMPDASEPAVEPEPRPAAFSAEILALREQGLGWSDIASVFGTVYFRLRFNEKDSE